MQAAITNAQAARVKATFSTLYDKLPQVAEEVAASYDMNPKDILDGLS
jgi:hypothetical protein